ncbi:MAG: sugar ABC transporter substrate-binding protein [Actinobacteria bacterium]|nr:sugar ABC transporter substrate-binding protein [Actinomycetota bacterium]
MAVLGVLALAVSAWGCGSAGEGTKTQSATAQGERRVGVLASPVSPYDKSMVDAAKEWGRTHNARIEVYDSSVDPQKQYAQVQDIIAQGKLDGFAILPLNGATLVPLLKEAKAAGIDVVAVGLPFSNDYTGRAPVNPDTAGVVWTPPPEAGRSFGQQYVAACRGVEAPCKVAYLSVAPGIPFESLAIDAMKKVVAEHPNIEFLPVVDGGQNRDAGLSATQDLLQAHPDVDVIGAADPILFGSEVAIKNAGRTIGMGPGDIRIVGSGATKNGIERIREGLWVSSITSVPQDEMKIALGLLDKAMRGEETEPKQVFSVRESGYPPIMNRENIEKTHFAGEYTG